MKNGQEQQVGGAIIAVSVIEFIFEGLSLLTSILYLLFKDRFNSAIARSGEPIPSSINYIMYAIVATLLIISVMLILLKNIIGIYAYFIVYIANNIYTIVENGINPIVLLGFILPIIMAILVYRKRTIFNLKKNN